MLVMTQRVGETIYIDAEIEIRLLEIRGGRVRVGVTAPPTVMILRGKVADKRHQTEDILKGEVRHGCT